jgi:hypothetical protein
MNKYSEYLYQHAVPLIPEAIQRPNSLSLTGGIKSTLTYGCRTGPPGYIGWQADTTILCHSRLYPPSQGI